MCVYLLEREKREGFLYLCKHSAIACYFHCRHHIWLNVTLHASNCMSNRSNRPLLVVDLECGRVGQLITSGVILVQSSLEAVYLMTPDDRRLGVC